MKHASSFGNRSHLLEGNWSLVAEFTEVESVSAATDPLQTPRSKACLHRVPLVVDKVDRLTRSLSFLTRLSTAA
jgi:hypothetical protein